MTDKTRLSTSAASRLLKLGGLVGRVGASLAADAVKKALKTEGDPSGSAVYAENAARIAEALGTLKGVPMKIGQMLSLHEGFLPPEVAEILSSLQQDAPPAPFDDIHRVLQAELQGTFSLVDTVEPHAHAAASIGQVHRSRLKDGREVVFKVQYPGIDQVIAADLKNLKGILKILFSMLTRMDLDPIWDELNARLTEELDYIREAQHMNRMRELWKDDPDIIIPEVLPELSTVHVLCMIYEKGLSPAWACSDDYSQAQRTHWASMLLKLFLTGLLEHRFLHADPNLANFSFHTDGRVVVYDFGCMKEVPESISNGYRFLTRAVLDERWADIPKLLRETGVHYIDGSEVPMAMVMDFTEVLRGPFERGRQYTFGEDSNIYEEVRALAKKHRQEAMDMTAPADLVFVDRTISGHFGNLSRFRASADWRKFLEQYL